MKLSGAPLRSGQTSPAGRLGEPPKCENDGASVLTMRTAGIARDAAIEAPSRPGGSSLFFPNQRLKMFVIQTMTIAHPAYGSASFTIQCLTPNRHPTQTKRAVANGHRPTLNPGENTGPLHRHPQEE